MTRKSNPILRFVEHHPLVSIASFLGVLLVALAIGWGVVLAKLPTTQQAYAPTPTATPKPEPAILEIFSSEVLVKLPKDTVYKKGETGMIIPEDTMVKTGPEGRAQIVFPGGTVTRLDFETEIKVDLFNSQKNQINIFLNTGRVWSRIKKLLGNELYQTESSTMIATVRGTSYGHGIVEGVFNRGTVTKGRVELICKNDKGELELFKDQTALVDCEKATGFEPTAMSDEFATSDWMLFNNAEDKKLNDRFGKDTYDDDEETDVLGAATSNNSGTPTRPTPTFRPSNTPRPSSTPRPGNAAQSATDTPTPYTPTPSLSPLPSNTPTPSPTPILPPTVDRAAETPVSARAVAPVYQSDITIYGTRFTPATYFRIIDPSGSPLSGAFQNRGTDGIDYLTIRFSNLRQCGNYEIEVYSGAAPTEFAPLRFTGKLTILNCPG